MALQKHKHFINVTLLAVLIMLTVVNAPTLFPVAKATPLPKSSTYATRLLLQKLNQWQTMTAYFDQRVFNDDHLLIHQQQGRMILKRPNYFLWLPTNPKSPAIIADGHHLWVYNKTIKQVIKYPIHTLRGTAATLLSGSLNNLQDEFFIQTVSSKNSLDIFLLLPKQKTNQFKSLMLFFSGEKLVKMRLVSQLDQTILLRFTHIQINPSISVHQFHFIPPKQVDIITSPS